MTIEQIASLCTRISLVLALKAFELAPAPMATLLLAIGGVKAAGRPLPLIVPLVAYSVTYKTAMTASYPNVLQC